MNCLSACFVALLCVASVSADPMDGSANTHWELVTEAQSYSVGQERPGTTNFFDGSRSDQLGWGERRLSVESSTELTGGEWLWGQTTWFPSPKPQLRPTPELKDPVLTGRAGKVTAIHSRQPWAELRCDGQAVGRLGEPVREWEARLGTPTAVFSQPQVLFYQRALVDIGLFVNAGVVDKIVLAEPGQLRPLLKP